MHAADDRVGLEHHVGAVGRREDGRIVHQPERPGVTRERPEISRDEAVLARLRLVLLHRRHPPPNSPVRSWRASSSSTALIMPVSSLSTKALATSTYSETTARAGTSRR